MNAPTPRDVGGRNLARAARAITLAAIVAGAGACTADATNPADPAAPEVTRYEAQPMVVDIAVEAEASDAIEVVDPDDPGVQAVELANDGDGWRPFRVRGLSPETRHVLSVRSDSGLDHEVDFTTYPPLPGYVDAFPVDGDPAALSTPYVFFDVVGFPFFENGGVFQVDANGVTRFYFGAAIEDITGPQALWAEASLRSDGSYSYLHDGEAIVRDELGEVSVRVSGSSLGYGLLHHDLVELDDGNFMALAYTQRELEYGDLGRVPVLSDVIVEFSPEGELIWEWNTFDHLDPQRWRNGSDTPVTPDARLPENIAYDWTHANAVVYDPRDDSVLLSMRHQDWIIKIDRSSGDVLWRLGAEGDFELADGGTWFTHQHAPEWQPDGTLLVYDNGVDNPLLTPAEERSRAVRYALDEDTMVATMVWEDDEPPFRVPIAGDADHIDDDQLLVVDSSIDTGMSVIPVTHGRIRQVDPQASPSRNWSIETVEGTLIYRAQATSRLVGEAATP